jgi:hypothetical protein
LDPTSPSIPLLSESVWIKADHKPSVAFTVSLAHAIPRSFTSSISELILFDANTTLNLHPQAVSANVFAMTTTTRQAILRLNNRLGKPALIDRGAYVIAMLRLTLRSGRVR